MKKKDKIEKHHRMPNGSSRVQKDKLIPLTKKIRVCLECRREVPMRSVKCRYCHGTTVTKIVVIKR